MHVRGYHHGGDAQGDHENLLYLLVLHCLRDACVLGDHASHLSHPVRHYLYGGA